MIICTSRSNIIQYTHNNNSQIIKQGLSLLSKEGLTWQPDAELCQAAAVDVCVDYYYYCLCVVEQCILTAVCCTVSYTKHTTTCIHTK